MSDTEKNVEMPSAQNVAMDDAAVAIANARAAAEVAKATDLATEASNATTSVEDLEEEKPVEQTEEESKPVKEEPVKQIDDRLTIPTGDMEAFFKAFNDKLEGLSKAEIQSLVRDNDKTLAAVNALRVLSDYETGTQGVLVDAFQKMSEGGSLKDQLTNDTEDKRATRAKLRGEVRGTNAESMFLASIRGMKKVYLYNSGFWVLIRPLTIAQLNSFYETVDLETKELGRDIGSVFFAFADVFLKQKFCELLSTIVVKSNLVGFEDENVLLQALDFHEYDVLVWAASCLLYKASEVTLPFVCVSKECDYKHSSTDIDLNKLRFDRTEHMTPEQIAFVRKSESVTLADVQKYRAELKQSHATLQAAGIEYELHTPSLAEYFAHSDKLTSDVIAYTQGAKSLRDQNVLNGMLMHFNRAFVPWIKKVASLDEDGSPVFWSEDDVAIAVTVEPDLHIDTTFFEDVQKFMLSSKITFICFTQLKCPMCGASPSDGTVEEFTPVDAQSLFFGLACRKLLELVQTSTRSS